MLVSLAFVGCEDPDTPPGNGGGNGGGNNNNNSNARLIFKFKFDPTQERLNNLGLPSSIPQGHAAQSPDFQTMGAHYVELAPSAFTAVGGGEVVYKSEETTTGGDQAIDFAALNIVEEGAEFLSVPIGDIAPGTYEYLRISLAYQNYDIDFRVTVDGFGTFDLTGRIASFLGYNTYITSHQINTQSVDVNSNKAQGFWAFETEAQAPFVPSTVTSGDASNTTVVNPISSTSPIPLGSCLVTGPFDNGLTITGEETEDIIVTVSLSTNNSFEWIDNNGNGIFEPVDGEIPVDMGIRGLIPIVE